VDTIIAACLILPDGVQEFVNVGAGLLVAVQVTMLPFSTGTAPTRVVSLPLSPAVSAAVAWML
jgi:hypothetical protein